jgi:predicted aldo/keto reductase-like oxidoreductase
MKTKQDRRTFIKTLAGGAAALGSSLAGWPGERETSPGPLPQDALARRPLGRTGLSVSEISLGSSPLPDPDLLRAIVDRGVNYIDTSHNYENGNAERRIGQLLKAVGRDRVHIATKFHVAPRDTPDSIIASVHGSLRRLGIETIDVLMIHGAETAAVLVDERVLEACDRLKKEGAFRFRGLSCHANQDEVVRKAVDCGLYDMVQVGYNVFDIPETEEGEIETYPDYLGRSGIRPLLELAHGRGVGIIAMKTLKVGGRRQDLGRYRTGAASIHQAMLKWVLDDARVASAVTEILNRQQMEEDLGAAGAKLSLPEQATLARYVRENAAGYCQGCARCRRACPAGVDTTGILRALAYHESYGKTERAREAYADIESGRRASACRDCGACEKACPSGVPVRARLGEAGSVLA